MNVSARHLRRNKTKIIKSPERGVSEVYSRQYLTSQEETYNRYELKAFSLNGEIRQRGRNRKEHLIRMQEIR